MVNLSPIANNFNNSPITPASTLYSNEENINEIPNSPSLVNNIMENNAQNYVNSIKQTLSGTLGGRYRIEGEVTLTPL